MAGARSAREPGYLLCSDVPAIFRSIIDAAPVTFDGGPLAYYSTTEWQRKWVKSPGGAQSDAAVISYRWRPRCPQADTKVAYLQWVADMRSAGYKTKDLQSAVTADWDLIDKVPIQVELAAWMIWCHSTKAAKYLWVDRFCIPQDVDEEVKVQAVRESVGIYRTGAVYAVMPPVVDAVTRQLITLEAARGLVNRYRDQVQPSHGVERMLGMAAKALMLNVSYMRRVWTIQEMVVAQREQTWPLLTNGDICGFQPDHVVDWPEFNKWGQACYQHAVRRRHDEALEKYYDGDYSGVLAVVREGRELGLSYLSHMCTNLKWAVADRGDLVKKLRAADARGGAAAVAERRAVQVLNAHQLIGARAAVPRDKVLALVPMVDYEAWLRDTAGVAADRQVQASVEWTHARVPRAAEPWVLRVYNHLGCTHHGPDGFVPRRNLSNEQDVRGRGQPCLLVAPASGPPASLSFKDGTALQLAGEPLWFPHPGNPGNWGEGPWKAVRDAMGADEDLRLTVEWGCEPYFNSDKHDDKTALVLVGTHQQQPLLVLVAMEAGGAAAGERRGYVMMVLDLQAKAIPKVLTALRAEGRSASVTVK